MCTFVKWGIVKVKCPDGWQSVMRFSRLGGIKDNHCLTPKPEANVRVCVCVCVRAQGQVTVTVHFARHLLQDEEELTFHCVYVCVGV